MHHYRAKRSVLWWWAKVVGGDIELQMGILKKHIGLTDSTKQGYATQRTLDKSRQHITCVEVVIRRNTQMAAVTNLDTKSDIMSPLLFSLACP